MLVLTKRFALTTALFVFCGAAQAMNHGSGHNHVTNCTKLHRAVINGDLEQVKRLVHEENVDVNCHNGDRITALHQAALSGRVKIVAWLVQEAGARTDLRDYMGRIPLHAAATNGCRSVVRWFITEGYADLDQPDHQGRTALFWSTILISEDEKGMETAQWLLNQGADPAGLYLEIPRQNRKILLRQRNQYVCAAKEAACEALVPQDSQWQTLLTLLHEYLGWKIVEPKELGGEDEDGIEETMEKLTEGPKCCRSCVIL